MAELLRKLSNLNAVSGNEDSVRNFIISEIQPYADSIKVDNMGNVIAFKKGRKGEKTVLLSAHMDEIGLIISGVSDDGYLKFKTVGNVNARYIVAKCVKINNSVSGVLGMKAIHLQKREERQKDADINSLYIDIGAKNRQKALKRVSLGDYAAFMTEFYDAGDKVWGKALESRIGCECLLELIQKEYDNDVYFAFTAQCEIGMRGASVAAYGLDIDRALTLDAVEAADMYGVKKEEMTAELGKGVCVEYMDRQAILDRDLTNSLKSAAKTAGIAVCDKINAIGLTDAGALQRSCEGIKTACIAVPVRYSHTPACMAAKSDMEAMKQLAELFIREDGE